MSLAVENPIVNSPFEEPLRYWAYKEGQPVLELGRRPAGYYLKASTREPQLSMMDFMGNDVARIAALDNV